MSRSWESVGLDEIGRDSSSGKVVLRIDPKAYNLPGNRQHGDPSKIKHAIGWESQLPFPVCVCLMFPTSVLKTTRKWSKK
jgi:GDP-D-mannose dehydratase